MKDLLFVVFLSLLAFGLINAVLSLAVVMVAPWLRFDCLPRARARRYLLVRAFPSAASVLFVAAFFLPVLCRSEPGNADERVSVSMCGLAIAALMILLTAMIRGMRCWRATERLSRSWEITAQQLELTELRVSASIIETAFPVAAIVGIVRPRLFVARSVLTHCSPEEFDAILAHELAHVANNDNLSRLLLRFFPDLLSWTSVATQLERGWSRACEEAADDEAVAAGRGLALASALCKVARLARGYLPVAALGIHGDGDVAHRLERLLRPPTTLCVKSRGRFDGLSFSMLLALPLLVASLELPRLHAATEFLVRLLS